MIRYDLGSNFSKSDINKIATKVKEGKVIIFPTSTVYGIGANALDKNAVQKVYNIKKRNYSKPCIVLVSDYEMLDKITYGLNDIQKTLSNNFWPGPLTMILNKKDVIPNIVTSYKDTVGIRIDENDIINDIIKEASVPIIAPSANISGKPCQDDVCNIDDELLEQVDYVLDDGVINEGKESTILNVEDNTVIILREGKISIKDIKRVFVNTDIVVKKQTICNDI